MSPEDLKDVAHDYQDLADAFVSWRAANPIRDPVLGEQFDDMVADLVATANKLENLALASALANIQAPMDELRAATQKAQHALSVIQEVSKALVIGGAAVGVVASLVAPAVTPGAVACAVSDLVQAVQKATKSKDGAKGSDTDA